MKPQEIIEAVELGGGRICLNGERLHVEAPVGVLTPELREAIRSRKPDILLLLRSTSVAQDRREQLETSRRRLITKGVGAFRITSSIYGDIWIALTEEAALGLSDLNGVTVYEARYLIPLTTAEIRILHDLRTIGGLGGSMETRKP